MTDGLFLFLTTLLLAGSNGNQVPTTKEILVATGTVAPRRNILAASP